MATSDPSSLIAVRFFAMMPNWKRLKTDNIFRERMRMRARIIASVRSHFLSKGFDEVETPVLVAQPGMEPNLSPFATELFDERARRYPAHLITSPEYAMKKLLAAGYAKIFEITRCFRNGEPFGGTHNPEFTMIEWYRANADYRSIMADTEEMVADAARAATGGTVITFRGAEIDLAPAWDRMTVAEAFDRFLSIDLGRCIEEPDRFRAEAAARGCATLPTDTFDDVFFRLFLRDIEPKLGSKKPVILHEYPRSMAALARLKPGDGRYAERFEAYVAGIELCNAFSELNDAAEQGRRLEAEREERIALGKEDLSVDAQFLEAVGMMPESAGIALGIDRLVLLLTDSRDIRDVLFFPASDLFEKGQE